MICIQTTAECQNFSGLASSIDFLSSDKNNDDELFDISEVLCINYISYLVHHLLCFTFGEEYTLELFTIFLNKLLLKLLSNYWYFKENFLPPENLFLVTRIFHRASILGDRKMTTCKQFLLDSVTLSP